MKKFGVVILTLVVIALVVAGCIVWYKSATKMPENPVINNPGGEIPTDIEKPTQEEPVQETPVSEEPIFTKENYPRVDASLAIHPLVDSIAANFMAVDVAPCISACR